MLGKLLLVFFIENVNELFYILDKIINIDRNVCEAVLAVLFRDRRYPTLIQSQFAPAFYFIGFCFPGHCLDRAVSLSHQSLYHLVVLC